MHLDLLLFLIITTCNVCTPLHSQQRACTLSYDRPCLWKILALHVNVRSRFCKIFCSLLTSRSSNTNSCQLFIPIFHCYLLDISSNAWVFFPQYNIFLFIVLVYMYVFHTPLLTIWFILLWAPTNSFYFWKDFSVLCSSKIVPEFSSKCSCTHF